MTTTTPTTRGLAPPSGSRVRSWPILLLALPAFVAIWSGWVGLGELTGFGPVRLLPGIWDGARINSAITLPIGMETYAAYALHIMLSARVSARARAFARWSAAGSLVLGAGGQVAYHLMSAARITHAPALITAVVACLPVAVLGMGAALAHLVREEAPAPVPASPPVQASTGNPRQARPARATTTPDTPRPKTGKPSAGADTAARVARLTAKHPDMPTAGIARRLGLSERTVRRHLNPTTPTGTDPEGNARTTALPTTDPSTTTTEPNDRESRAA